jgi:hypothetical protein
LLRKTIFKTHITDNKFSDRQINAIGDKKGRIYIVLEPEPKHLAGAGTGAGAIYQSFGSGSAKVVIKNKN